MTQIRTARLLLRRARPDDVAAIHAIMSDPHAMRYWSSLPHETLEVTADWIREMLEPQVDGRSLFVAEHEGRVVGRLGIWKLPEVGYIFHPEYWGRGFATEAMQGFIAHTFATTDTPEITADVDPRNDASLKLLGRLGFVITGTAQNTFLVGDEWSDSVYLSLRRPEAS